MASDPCLFSCVSAHAPACHCTLIKWPPFCSQPQKEYTAKGLPLL